MTTQTSTTKPPKIRVTSCKFVIQDSPVPLKFLAIRGTINNIPFAWRARVIEGDVIGHISPANRSDPSPYIMYSVSDFELIVQPVLDKVVKLLARRNKIVMYLDSPSFASPEGLSILKEFLQ